VDAPAGESEKLDSKRSWLARERDSGRFYSVAAIAVGAVLLATVAFSLWALRRPATPGSLLSPPLIAALLIANLIPAIALMVLLSRRIAMVRAEKGGVGSGRLHTRLVALFSVIAAVPTVLVAIFASLLFQSGLEFWFSDRARGMLENSVQLARTTYNDEVERVANETVAASGDLTQYLQQAPIDSPEFLQAFGKLQVLNRNLSEAIIFTYGADKQVRSLVLINPYDRALEQSVPPEKIEELKSRQVVSITSPDRIGAVTRLAGEPNVYLYEARVFDPEFRAQIDRANDVLHDYQALLSRSRINQLRFNAALLFGSLIIVALAILAALRLADRLVRPVGQLAEAAGRIEQGDFTARVPITRTEDEIQTLAHAFNRMTDRLQEQTDELRSANTQLDTRRAFIEAVLSSVTAGVVALDSRNRILLSNKSADALLEPRKQALEGTPLKKVSAELDEFMGGDEREANVDVETERGQRTLAVKRVRYQDGTVITFDDITDQLSDQRSAAWSDIARRIAHEIKNPLTPIQLAAERLQRRFGGEVQSDSETFERLTGTIVRQVGDLRRMVDEFSNFARMPKPVFRAENVHDIAHHALFLHEVAHPEIKFSLEPETGDFTMVCDRRQLGQALTNVVKNAVEAIESRRSRGEHHFGGDRVELRLRRDGEQLVIDIMDTGIGLPEDRERLTEPYMTTRVRGTGLGLAIVKKIVEEHCGEIAFLDRQGGGTHVRIAFDAERLESKEGEGPEPQSDGENEDGTYI
jgi:two-component system nitrogen regulation sensor histidine kinase NtrY